MILEYLQPNPDIWDGVTVVVRAAYYVASLGAAGLAAFALAFGHRLVEEEVARLRRVIGMAVLVAMLLSLAAAVVRVQLLSAGDLSDLKVWEAMFRSRIGDAFYLRMAGLALIGALAFPWRLGPALAGAGILLVIGSYAAMGHSMLYRPRQELAAIVVVHLACVAFWAGSLVPLAWVARRGDAAAAGLVEDWSRVALLVVAVLVASGVLGAILLIGRADLVLGSWYGNAFLVKIALVAVVMAFAARHKLVLSRDLSARVADAPDRLARSIRLETVAMILVFYAAAELVSVHPVDLGHRIR
jgi:putative copper export protein